VEEAKQTEVSRTNNLYEPNSYETFIDLIQSLNQLHKIIMLKIKKMLPSYKAYDIAVFAGLQYYVNDLMLAVLAGQPHGIAKYRAKFVNNQYSEKVREKLMIAIHNEEEQYQPSINTCPHVKNMNTIDKVQDDAQRMQLLTKFLRTYEKTKKDNFVICNIRVHDSNCLCEHTYLQLQEYLHPREKDTIHKELLLRFSAGVFQGRFICGNCGQTISNLEFDTSLEYGDTGAPMMGRAELVDTEAMEEDEMNILLGKDTTLPENTLDTPAKTLYYQKTVELFDAIGITPDADACLRIINGIDTRVLSRPSMDTYAKLEKRQNLKEKNRYV
jgi:hypothetical protein